MKMGGLVFIIGLVLAVLIGIFSAANVPQWAIYVMAILGILVGLLNVQDKEVMMFLVAALAFMLSFQSLSNVIESLLAGWKAVGAFFVLMNVFVAPAAAVVAVKAVYNLAKD